MAQTDQDKSWERLKEVVGKGNPVELHQFLESLPPNEIARAISRLTEEDQSNLLTLLPPEDAADLIEELPEAQGADLLEDLSVDAAAKIVDEMESDVRADVLGELTKNDAEAILQKMQPDEAKDARQLLSYPKDTAGGIMITEYLAYREDLTIADVLSDLRHNADTYSDYSVQYVYVISADGTLVGVIKLRDLVLSPDKTPLKAISISDPMKTVVTARLPELEQLFDRRAFFGLPVVDEKGKLVGVVQKADIEQARGESTQRTFLRFGGIVGGDESRTMHAGLRMIRRLSFLTPNIFLDMFSSGIIAYYEGTLQKVIALAVFLPILSDMSGCAGNQAVAVSIRELSLGIIQPRDFIRVWWQEARVGIPNGIALGILLGIVTLCWKGTIYLALVVGVAMGVNTVIAVSVGGMIPLALRAFKVDPALAAAPLLTTVTDMCGFFISLSLAAVMLKAGKL